MDELSSSKVFRPMPRRLDSNQPPSPLLTSGLLNESPSRTQSALNLTSSTLKGIFSPAVYESEQEPLSTPVGTVIPISPHPPKKKRIIDLTIRAILLFTTGMCYGFLIQNLQDKPQLFLYEVANQTQRNISRIYLFLWGISGVAIGTLLPRIDASFSLDNTLIRNSPKGSKCNTNENSKMEENNILRQGWTPVIRSVGAFVGVSFALRKLPWSSTFQASLALSLVNPVLWYLIDRSKSGFFLSSAIGASGTAVLLVLKSKVAAYPTLQSPIKTYYAALMSDDRGRNAVGLYFVGKENLEDAIWMWSVLFCSCICFGNIGRRLALDRKV